MIEPELDILENPGLRKRMSIQPVRGMHDLMPSDHALHKAVIACAQTQAALYGFQEVSTPIVEYREVFDRTVETSDLVMKEMYTVMSRSATSDSPMVLRPEGTAPLMRAVLSEGLTQDLPLKFFYTGPMFRYDRPQKGRLRQFHQIGVEFIGVAAPWADVEILAFAHHFLEELGIRDRVVLEINTLGDSESYAHFREKLSVYLLPYASELSPESQVRLTKNPLRILDSKSPHDQKILENAPSLPTCLTPAAQLFFDQVREGLEILGIPYTLSPQLVRGLDYYAHTAFEFTTTDLGAQGTVLGGGRYDGLSSLLGGPPLPGIGWAAGIERLALLTTLKPSIPSTVALIPQGEADLWPAMLLAQQLRGQGIPLQLMGGSQNLSKKLQKAQKAGHQFVLILGEKERTEGTVTLKDLTKSQQEVMHQEGLGGVLKKCVFPEG